MRVWGGSVHPPTHAWEAGDATRTFSDLSVGAAHLWCFPRPLRVGTTRISNTSKQMIGRDIGAQRIPIQHVVAGGYSRTMDDVHAHASTSIPWSWTTQQCQRMLGTVGVVWRAWWNACIQSVAGVVDDSQTDVKVTARALAAILVHTKMLPEPGAVAQAMRTMHAYCVGKRVDPKDLDVAARRVRVASTCLAGLAWCGWTELDVRRTCTADAVDGFTVAIPYVRTHDLEAAWQRGVLTPDIVSVRARFLSHIPGSVLESSSSSCWTDFPADMDAMKLAMRQLLDSDDAAHWWDSPQVGLM
jgi:hypothetical protein